MYLNLIYQILLIIFLLISKTSSFITSQNIEIFQSIIQIYNIKEVFIAVPESSVNQFEVLFEAIGNIKNTSFKIRTDLGKFKPRHHNEELLITTLGSLKVVKYFKNIQTFGKY